MYQFILNFFGKAERKVLFPEELVFVFQFHEKKNPFSGIALKKVEQREKAKKEEVNMKTVKNGLIMVLNGFFVIFRQMVKLVKPT